MSAKDIEVRTCSGSLLAPGRCCFGVCQETAVSAVIYGDLVEHARCGEHDRNDPWIVASKPLQWNPLWGPGDDA